MLKLTLSEIMTPNVHCLSPDDDMITVITSLGEKNYSCCVVADENKIPVGLLTDRNIISIIGKNGNSPELMAEKISNHMVASPFTLPESTDLNDALKLVEDRSVRHILVTNSKGEILGIVSQSDLIRAYDRIMVKHTEGLEKAVDQRTKQLEEVNRKLMNLSMIDTLTGLGNRRAMEVDIMKVHAIAIRQLRPYSLVLFDIDYFKKYNDHYGHQAGDTILEVVANHFRNESRDSDTVFRYGGEEFLMIMPDTDAEEALIPVQRIVKSLCESEIEHSESPLKCITTSAGIACSNYNGSKITNWRQIVELADKGLYDAKHAGRNQVIASTRNTLKAVN